MIYLFMIILITFLLQFTLISAYSPCNCSLYMIVLEVWFIKLDQHLAPRTLRHFKQMDIFKCRLHCWVSGLNQCQAMGRVWIH